MAYGDRDKLIELFGDRWVQWRAEGMAYNKIAELTRQDYGHPLSVEKVRQLCLETFQRRKREEEERATRGWVNLSAAEPLTDEPIEDLIARKLNETQRTMAREARREYVAAMSSDPFGVFIFGDPHLDSPGSRWDLIMRHVAALRRTSARIECVNIGDTNDNWVGRLARLYADHGTTAAEGWRLARWLLGQREEDARLSWLAMVGGNHDAWSHTAGLDPYAEICRWAGIEYYDSAEVRIRLTFPDAADMVLLFRHDFAGRSWFHSTHGPGKEAMLDPEADLLAAGHLHQWGTLHQEHRGGRCPLALRVRGYKDADHYAREKGFYSGRYGHACLVAVMPHAEGPGRLIPFWDIDAGIAFLEKIKK